MRSPPLPCLEEEEEDVGSRAESFNDGVALREHGLDERFELPLPSRTCCGTPSSSMTDLGDIVDKPGNQCQEGGKRVVKHRER